MKCKFCGNDLPEESKFCPSCGAPVEPEEKQEQEQSEQSAEAQQQENQNPYEYGVPGTDNGSGAQNENPYQYGSAGQDNENPYQYGSAGQNNENPYQYGSTGQNTSADYNANNGTYGQPQKPINGTTYLIFAIISTLLCCLPLGIVAIVYACKINSLQRSGDYAGAQNAAKKAKMFTIIGTVAALVVSIFYIIFAIVIGIGSSDFDDDPVSNVVENVIEDKNDSKKRMTAISRIKQQRLQNRQQPAVDWAQAGTVIQYRLMIKS
ncbi:CD225/dispanin family protein [Dorea formicigenerans]|uniref:CD225/dispanin family protein n=1 Tax=Dorea formicigenerans TaxID=39486 RepID=UPI001FA873A9|nr:CD225/dispanin family protein [Dorea formicigenerans]